MAEKVYIGCATLPLIGSLLLVMGIFDLYFGRSGAWIVLLVFPVVSLVLTIWGMSLAFEALVRKTLLWPLILATIMASSYCVLIFGKYF